MRSTAPITRELRVIGFVRPISDFRYTALMHDDFDKVAEMRERLRINLGREPTRDELTRALFKDRRMWTGYGRWTALYYRPAAAIWTGFVSRSH